MGVDGCWCAPRSSKPLQVVRSCPGGFDSHILSPIKTIGFTDGFDFINILRIIANMLKLTSISCFSIVMPNYIDNLMIMGYLITMQRISLHRQNK